MINKLLSYGLYLGILPLFIFWMGFFNVFVEVLPTLSKKMLVDLFNYNLFFSVFISLLSASISCFVGSFLAFKTIDKYRGVIEQKLMRFIVFMPHLAFAYLVYLMFSSSGILARFSYPLLENISLINDSYGIGIVIHYVLKEVPFVFLYLMATQERKDFLMKRTAKNLGLSTAENFFRVYLPLKREPLGVCFILIFTYSLSSYEAAYILGGSQNQFISVSMLENFQSIDEWSNSLSKVQSLFLFAVNSCVCMFVLKLIRRGR